MKRPGFDKSSILLIVIIAIFAGSIGFAAFAMRADEVRQALSKDSSLNIAVILESGGAPISTQLFMFYPGAGKGALLDIPGETGVILSSKKRMDRLDSVYEPGRAGAYVRELAAFLDTSIDGWIVFDEAGLVRVVDLMEGLELFLPTMVIREASEGVDPIRLPGGAVTLDGDKVLQFARYREEGESGEDAIARRQKLFQAMVKRVAEKSGQLRRRDVFPAFSSALQSSFEEEGRLRFVTELAKLDADRIMLQRVTGTTRSVDGQMLLFPHYDGELVRDIVKQTLSALASSSRTLSGTRIFTVEILNATPNKGLASRTAGIFQSFGYEVVAVGNDQRTDRDRTVIIDHYGNAEALGNLQAVIKCENTASSASRAEAEEAVADFTIILGKDFNGRYCVR